MKKIPTRSHRSPVSLDACPVCGTPMKEKRGKLAFPVNGEDVRVPDATHLACPKGHDPVLRADDARRLRERALDMYRCKYGLLTAEDLRSLRERLGVTQAELARLLRLGQSSEREAFCPARSRSPARLPRYDSSVRRPRCRDVSSPKEHEICNNVH